MVTVERVVSTEEPSCDGRVKLQLQKVVRFLRHGAVPSLPF